MSGDVQFSKTLPARRRRTTSPRVQYETRASFAASDRSSDSPTGTRNERFFPNRWENQLKRGYWVIESPLHHALGVSLDEDRGRVRHVNAALVLGMFRRLVVRVAHIYIWVVSVQT